MPSSREIRWPGWAHLATCESRSKRWSDEFESLSGRGEYPWSRETSGDAENGCSAPGLVPAPPAARRLCCSSGRNTAEFGGEVPLGRQLTLRRSARPADHPTARADRRWNRSVGRPAIQRARRCGRARNRAVSIALDVAARGVVAHRRAPLAELELAIRGVAASGRRVDPCLELTFRGGVAGDVARIAAVALALGSRYRDRGRPGGAGRPAFRALSPDDEAERVEGRIDGRLPLCSQRPS